MRRRYVFSGRVQGVGFRATASDIAQDFKVTGWVKNEPDGTVTLEIQGEDDQIEEYMTALKTAMVRYVTSTRVLPSTPVEGERGFVISR